jgi:hypothetical protein
MACAALVTAALFVFVLWLNKPTFWCSVGLGVTVALAVLSKMTALGFLVISGGSIAAAYALYRFSTGPGEGNHGNPPMKIHLGGSVIALLLCALTRLQRFAWDSTNFPRLGLAERRIFVVFEGCFCEMGV